MFHVGSQSNVSPTVTGFDGRCQKTGATPSFSCRSRFQKFLPKMASPGATMSDIFLVPHLVLYMDCTFVSQPPTLFQNLPGFATLVSHKNMFFTITAPWRTMILDSRFFPPCWFHRFKPKYFDQTVSAIFSFMCGHRVLANHSLQPNKKNDARSSSTCSLTLCVTLCAPSLML